MVWKSELAPQAESGSLRVAIDAQHLDKIKRRSGKVCRPPFLFSGYSLLENQACAERLRPLLLDLLIGSPQQHEKLSVSLERSGTEPLTAV